MSLGFIFAKKEFAELLSVVEDNQLSICVSGLPPPARPFLLAALLSKTTRPIVYLRPHSRDLSDFKQNLNFYLSLMAPQAKAHVLSPLGDNPYADFPPSLESVATRMKYFYTLHHRIPHVTLTNPLGLLKRMPSASLLPNFFLEIAEKQEFPRDRLINWLIASGYQRQDIVGSPGECAWRGGVVDVFSPWRSFPFRLEFSGDEIVSLREFHPQTQRSQRGLKRIVIPGLNEYPSNLADRVQWKQVVAADQQPSCIEDLEKKIEAVENGDCFPAFNFMAALDHSLFVSFLSYFQNAFFILEDSQEMMTQWDKHWDFLQKERAAFERERKFAPSPGKIFDVDAWEKLIQQAMSWEEIGPRQRKIINFSFQTAPRFHNRLPFFIEYLRKKVAEGNKIAIFLATPALRERMSLILQEHALPSQVETDPLRWPPREEISIYQGLLERGFSSPQDRLFIFAQEDILTEERVVRHRRRNQPFLSSFQDLKKGDYILHADYGLGLFKGLVKLPVDGLYQDFIELEYRDGDKLYVPVEDLSLLQKYTPMGTSSPSLHKLGTATWDRIKARAKKAIEEMAQELLDLYAQRKALQGVPFAPGGEWEQEFSQAFEYTETEDQLRAIEEVLQDMESQSPMDRLLCGDVGYGKTEVALRACFRAVMNGKQVAVLCPTTVLASQHLATFRRRMSLFPVRIEALTRFQTPSQQKVIVKDLKKGLIDVVIGTHRLLSSDVSFKDLGLLIVDEEQRFGVRHKEKIKQMKTTVDVLTMTATPIPRTLNFSLYGLRDISLIETPPRDRLAVHTVVVPFNRQIIEAAIRKELAREGQVYFIHNRVDDIEAIAEKIRHWIPEARVVVLHGQMRSSVLEKRMIEFIHHHYDVLVSTAIIENGIDIPLVNTLIVNRADRFGLAQLYQLRGRVGRSSRQAYAYFLVPPYSSLSPSARERLRAIQEFTALGSGFRLAARDLEIRGAGELLGERQHGLLATVGFDFYLKLLEQTVKELKGEEYPGKLKCEINLRVNIRIPEDYLPQISLRLNLYKRISAIEQLSDLEKIREEIIDRYGPLPPEVENLLVYGAIKCLAQQIYVKSLDRLGQRLVINFHQPALPRLPQIIRAMQKKKGHLTPQGVLSLPLRSQTEKGLLEETKLILLEFKRIYYNVEN